MIGRDDAVVTCLAVKSFDCKTVFETPVGTVPISSLYVQNDTMKIYAASGTSVSGINKKGKVYCSLKSNMAENIQNIQVQKRVIMASGEYVLVSMDESGKELHYYMSPDQINDLYKIDNIAVLGCQDSTLRVVEGGVLTFEVALSGAVRSLTELSKTPVRARTVHEEGTDRKKGSSSLLGRFRKGKKKDKDGSLEEGKDAGGKMVEGGEGGDGDGRGEGAALGGSKIENNDTSSESKSKVGGKSASADRHGAASASALDASFVYGTMTGGIGAVNVEDGVARKSWFIPPPRSGKAR